jgi:acyltransferase
MEKSFLIYFRYETSTSVSKTFFPFAMMRRISLDIAKGFGITTVILIHTGFLPFQYQILPVLTPWMLSIFAVISGILAYDSQDRHLSSSILKKTRSLLIPYLTFGIVSFILWLQLRWYAPESALFDSWTSQLQNFVTGKGLTFNGPLWFLPAFFISSSLLLILKKYLVTLHACILTGISLLFVYLGVLINPDRTQFIFSYDLAFIFLGFSIFGMVSGKVNKYMTGKKMIFPLTIIYILSCMGNGTIDILQRTYHHWFLFWVSGTVGSFLIIQLSEYIATTKFFLMKILSHVGRASLVILCTHWPIMQMMTYLVWSIGLVSFLSGTPGLAAFSYYHPNKYIFTIIEIPLLLLYTIIPMYIGLRSYQINIFHCHLPPNLPTGRQGGDRPRWQ